MVESSSYVNSTPLAHADTSTDVLPRGEVSGHALFPQTSLDRQDGEEVAYKGWQKQSFLERFLMKIEPEDPHKQDQVVKRDRKNQVKWG
ncbi:hypothetical protein TNCV_3780441 [Trichonephila clavipes]|nr:hypothetical protein TNCV_3780441 [Trichonephila clavipes]